SLLRVWNLPTRRVRHDVPFSSPTVHGLAFSSDGRRLAAAGRTADIWDVASGSHLQTIRGHAGLTFGVDFSPDGKSLATAGADRTVRLWDVASGSERLILRGHIGRAVGVSYHPTGQSLASCDQGMGEVKVWDLSRHPEYASQRAPSDKAP